MESRLVQTFPGTRAHLWFSVAFGALSWAGAAFIAIGAESLWEVFILPALLASPFMFWLTFPKRYELRERALHLVSSRRSAPVPLESVVSVKEGWAIPLVGRTVVFQHPRRGLITPRTVVFSDDATEFLRAAKAAMQAAGRESS